MATAAQYAATARAAIVQISTANTNHNGTGTEILTAPMQLGEQG